MSQLQLRVREVVEGVITGLHKSPHRGFSVEFSEHREYVPGDELRHLNWRAYARSDRYYIKLYEQETNLHATLVVDTSMSMQFAEKMDYGLHLAACLAFLLINQQDLAGLVTVDDQIRLELPPASSPGHLDRLLRALEDIQPGRFTNLPEALHRLAEQLPRRSLVLLISDLWVDVDELTRALQHLRYRHHQVLILHLLDKAEIDLSYDKPVTLQDLETGEKLQIHPAEIRNTYRVQVQQYLQSIRRICNDCNVEYHPMYVDQPYDKALVALINRRG